MWQKGLIALAGLLLGACGGGMRQPSQGVVLQPTAFLSCVPFARALSGLELFGDAHTWWESAAGKYDRDQVPQVGSVLVFSRTSRLRSGHLSVVTRVVSPREIRVTHANWASGSDRGRVHADAPVIDVSSGNDWTVVRVWHAPSDSLGVTLFPTRGFIHPLAPPDAATIGSRVAPAMTLASLDRRQQ
jgi:surface antigen